MAMNQGLELLWKGRDKRTNTRIVTNSLAQDKGSCRL